MQQSGLAKVSYKSFLIKFQANSLHKAENSKPVTDRLDQTNTNQNERFIFIFDFSTPYTILPHKDLLKVLFDLTDFDFNGGSKKKTDFSLQMLFGRTSLKKKCYNLNIMKKSCFFSGRLKAQFFDIMITS